MKKPTKRAAKPKTPAQKAAAAKRWVDAQKKKAGIAVMVRLTGEGIYGG